MDKTQAIDSAIAQVERQFGKGAIMRMGDRTTHDIPAVPTGSLKGWTGVSKATGKFTAKLILPGTTKAVTGNGLYLPKSNSAWGYFPGTTIGGRIQLTVP